MVCHRCLVGGNSLGADVQMAPAESRAGKRKGEDGGLGSKQRRPASHTRTNNRETTHLARDEQREAEGTRTSAGRFCHLYTRGFHPADDAKKYVHFPVERLWQRRRERGLMLGVRWSGGCCVPTHLAWISVAAIEPPNIQASTLLEIHIHSLESHCQTTAVNTPQILDKALHKRAHLRGCGCVCLCVCVCVCAFFLLKQPQYTAYPDNKQHGCQIAHAQNSFCTHTKKIMIHGLPSETNWMKLMKKCLGNISPPKCKLIIIKREIHIYSR